MLSRAVGRSCDVATGVSVPLQADRSQFQLHLWGCLTCFGAAQWAFPTVPNPNS